MTELIIQYILILIMVLAVGYLAYFLKEKGVIIKNDYFGISYTILGMLTNSEATPENIKIILRVVSAAVHIVEQTLKDKENHVKENEALQIAKDKLKELELNSEINDESIRYMIRLTCALLPSCKK